MNPLLKKQWVQATKNNPSLLKLLPHPPMICWSRPKNMSEELIRAQIPKSTSLTNIIRSKNGFVKCGVSRCYSDSFTQNTKTHTANATKKSWPIFSKTSCFTKHAIYSCSCKKCNMQYIGLVGNREARVCWTEHRNSVNSLVGSPSTAIGKHFNERGHTLTDMEFCVIEQVMNRSPFYLKARESYWISEYECLDSGLNSQK